MAQTKKQKFFVGDIVRYADGDVNRYEVVEARYVIFYQGADWEYTIKDVVNGTVRHERGSSLLVKAEEEKVERKKKQGYGI